MTPRLITLGIALAALLVLPQPLFAQEAPEEAPEEAISEEEQAGLQAWLESIEPGEQHAMLAKRVGSWTTVTKMWLEGPDRPPAESPGTAEITTVLGGRFVVETSTSSMMGVPFEGIGHTGYDKVRKQFVSSWIDNFGTGITLSRGLLGRDQKTIHFYGEMDEPGSGEIAKPIYMTLVFVDHDTTVFTLFDIAHGDGAKGMEITYSRVRDEE